ncbi:MAG: hypothetical protein HOI84_01140 [Flavobacteriaceae bacterium]|jgi:hypothetical protein|nr:hypothetical protein [Flavobacteriaceae bacterium]
MRICLLFFFLFINAVGQEKLIGDFTHLTIKDGLHVTLIKSDKNAIVITGHDKEDVKYINKNGRLKIRMKALKSLQGFNTNIELFYNKEVDFIDVNQGAYLSIIDTIQQSELQLLSRKGAEIEAVLYAKDVIYKASTGGNITARGEVENQKIKIKMGGTVDIQRVLSKTSKATIIMGGVCEVQATSLFELSTILGGYARVYGKPITSLHKRTIGGTIKFLNQID